MADKLFSEFPPVSTEQWEAQILKDLKGADYQKKLVWRTDEGFNVKPYYRAEDMPKEQLQRAEGKVRNTWSLFQSYDARESLQQANEEALQGLMGGVEMVGFCMDAKRMYTLKEMEVLLNGIEPKCIDGIAFTNLGQHTLTLMQAFFEYVSERGLRKEEVKARFELKPQINETSLAILKECLLAAAGYSHVKVCCVSGFDFHCKGATLVQELAFSLALAKDVVEKLSASIPVEELLGKMYFTFAVGPNYFMEIAKFRVAGALWQDWVANHKGIPAAQVPVCIHAVTSPMNQTIYDMYVNQLRGTTEAMSAAIAGVDSLEVIPLDFALHVPADFSLRLARNIQLILKEEVHLDQVVDPSAGSYYIENLSASMAAAAKELAEKVQWNGMVDALLEQSAERRRQSIAKGRDVLLGVNKFPNFTENAPKGLTTKQLEDDERGAAVFERMRLRTEESGTGAKAFLLTFGNLAMCRARAQFAANFFAVAGIRIIDNNRFATIQEGVASALASGAQLVVACSADDAYAEAVPQIAQAIGDKAIVVVAGEPECKDLLIEQGITHFISVRSNLLETLQQYQKELGI